MKILPPIPLLLLLAANLYAQTAEPVSVPGTRISLVPPPGFVAATQFSGFIDEARGASIIVVEMPGPWSQVSAGLSDSARMAGRGLSLLSRQEITINQVKGLLVRLGQSAHGIDYLKWALVFGDENESVMITAIFPAELDGELSAKMKQSILSATWARSKQVPSHEGLDFTVSESGDIRFARRMANALVYSRDGIFPSMSNYDPLFIVGQSMSRGRIDNPEEFAITRAHATVDVADIRIETTEPVAINGLDGYEIVAMAKDRDSGVPMLLYYTLLFENGAYYIMHGAVSADNRETYLGAFREMTRSFRRLR